MIKLSQDCFLIGFRLCAKPVQKATPGQAQRNKLKGNHCIVLWKPHLGCLWSKTRGFLSLTISYILIGLIAILLSPKGFALEKTSCNVTIINNTNANLTLIHNSKVIVNIAPSAQSKSNVPCGGKFSLHAISQGKGTVAVLSPKINIAQDTQLQFPEDFNLIHSSCGTCTGGGSTYYKCEFGVCICEYCPG